MVMLITLTSDFGDRSPYVAAMKGVIVSIEPAAVLLDLSHQIRPQDLHHADYFLGSAIPHFPQGTIHVAVVDPGVGGERRPLLIEAAGRWLIGPDNGLFSRTIDRLGGTPCVRHLTEPRFWLPEVSATFHGRDLFAPVAAHLARGTDPGAFGVTVDEWVKLPHRSAVCWRERCAGEVQFVDDFGNLITNIPQGLVKSLPARAVLGGGEPVCLSWVRTYADAAPGELVTLFSSDGYFEIAVVQGNAAERLGAAVGTPIELTFG
jgi:S-adenosylmethionine hydrolase